LPLGNNPLEDNSGRKATPVSRETYVCFSDKKHMQNRGCKLPLFAKSESKDRSRISKYLSINARPAFCSSDEVWM